MTSDVPRTRWARGREAFLVLALAGPPLLLQLRRGAVTATDHLEPAAALLTGLGGLLLVHRIVDDLAGRAVAAWTTLALLYGTFLLADMTAGPDALPHTTSFTLAALALTLAWEMREARLPARVFTATAALLAAAAVPYLVANVAPVPRLPQLAETLFASRGGLLYWTPILWAGFLGYVPLARREGRWVAVPALGMMTVLVAATSGVGTGHFFAGGRFHAALPFLGLGLGAAFAELRAVVARRPLIPVVAGAGALVLWNTLFMEQYRTDAMPRDFAVSFAQVTETNAAILSEAVGSPVAWPANWLFAWRHGVPAARYDFVVGQSLFGDGGLGGAIVIGDDRVDPALLAEGWGPRRPCGGALCREVLGEARLLVPVTTVGPVRMIVHADGAGTLTLHVNGRRVADMPLGPALAPVALPQPFGVWHRGVNHVVLSCAPPGEARIERLGFEPEEGTR